MSQYQFAEKSNGAGGTELVRQVMEDVFIPLFWDRHACHRVGFTHISPLVGTTSGWYLWVKDRRGVYLLELTDVETLRPAESQKDIYNHNYKPDVSAHFVLRYYPSPDEHIFDEFALVERQVRLGPFFDHTGTPRFEKREEIHEFLFAVGGLRLVTDHDLPAIYLGAWAQDRWIEIRKQGFVSQNDTGGKEVSVSQISTERNVPGWGLAWSFFDKLLLGFCYVRKSTPGSLRLSRSPGSIWHIGPDDQVQEIRKEDVTRWTLELALSIRPIGDSGFPEISKGGIVPESTKLFPDEEEVLTEVNADMPEGEHPWINPDWWKASSWVFPPPDEFSHCCFKEH